MYCDNRFVAPCLSQSGHNRCNYLRRSMDQIDCWRAGEIDGLFDVNKKEREMEWRRRYFGAMSLIILIVIPAWVLLIAAVISPISFFSVFVLSIFLASARAKMFANKTYPQDMRAVVDLVDLETKVIRDSVDTQFLEALQMVGEWEFLGKVCQYSGIEPAGILSPKNS